MIRFERLAAIVRTLPMLGLGNLLRVIAYRVKIAAGLRPSVPVEPCPPGSIFANPEKTDTPLGPVELLLFGWVPSWVDGIPKWHINPLTPTDQIDSNLDWPDALRALNGRDVKPFWELSRFDWLPQWTLDARNGDIAALKRLNTWAADWVHQNPPYRGINWACGQEAAIRVMNLAMSQIILGDKAAPSSSLAWLVETSARRIRPTLNYALGQDNNHGSAEACALFIAGTWGQLWKMPDADDMAQLGRRWLENRALRLIQSDGSPCQYSTTYHRANLETFCVAELWRCHVTAAPFKVDVVKRIADGARWLNQITDPGSGDAPNFGANDGSHLFNFPHTPYRDFRPTVSLAARLFDNASAYSDPNFLDARVNLFNLPPATHSWVAPRGRSYNDGGFHVLRHGAAVAAMRYPRFRFRPSQADALHLDLWLGGANLLRDAGSYSYNTEPHWLNYFGGTASHNTVQFDDRDQMPRLSRFLFGDWLKAFFIDQVAEDGQTTRFGAGYRDARGASHQRRVVMRVKDIRVMDEVAGFATKGVLRWRLKPGDWRVAELNGGVICTNIEGHSLTVEASMPVTRCEIVTGWESRHYLEKTPLPVLEIEIHAPGTLTTVYRWVS
jgi:hypothetical protein